MIPSNYLQLEKGLFAALTYNLLLCIHSFRTAAISAFYQYTDLPLGSVLLLGIGVSHTSFKLFEKQFSFCQVNCLTMSFNLWSSNFLTCPLFPLLFVGFAVYLICIQWLQSCDRSEIRHQEPSRILCFAVFVHSPKSGIEP